MKYYFGSLVIYEIHQQYSKGKSILLESNRRNLHQDQWMPKDRQGQRDERQFNILQYINRNTLEE